MVSHSRDPNPSAAEFDEEEHIEQLERERVDGEEIGGHHVGYLFAGRPECDPLAGGQA
jgi:hypothetical protein